MPWSSASASLASLPSSWSALLLRRWYTPAGAVGGAGAVGAVVGAAGVGASKRWARGMASAGSRQVLERQAWAEGSVRRGSSHKATAGMEWSVGNWQANPSVVACSVASRTPLTGLACRSEMVSAAAAASRLGQPSAEEAAAEVAPWRCSMRLTRDERPEGGSVDRRELVREVKPRLQKPVVQPPEVLGPPIRWRY